MKNLNNYIFEKLNVKDIRNQYKYFPKTKEELRQILEKRLKEDKNADLNDIDVSQITNMASLFAGLDPHNIDISEWDVSNVTNMSNMFVYCKNFNSDLSNWNVSKCTYMSYMFDSCKYFNCDLNNWDVSNVINMKDMFFRCTSLKNKPSWYK
jgi:surface protein